MLVSLPFSVVFCVPSLVLIDISGGSCSIRIPNSNVPSPHFHASFLPPPRSITLRPILNSPTHRSSFHLPLPPLTSNFNLRFPQ